MNDLTIAEALLQANTPQKLHQARSRMLSHIAEQMSGFSVRNQQRKEKRILAAFKANIRRLPDFNLSDDVLNERVSL